jgi:segregation and condensation protein A
MTTASEPTEPSAASAEHAATQAEGGEVSSPAPALGSDVPDGYRVSLPMFEGPLDLLLHLVQKHELDILNIPIAFITERYTAYIRLLEELNIDMASEYLVMAATLVHIKSRLLLPNPPVLDEEDVDEIGIDPRADLVRRLLEYQKYKSAAEELASRSILGKDVFPRGSSLELAGGAMPLMAVNMFQLLDAFQSVLQRTSRTRDHEIDFERFSISERISELSDRLRQHTRLAFSDIFGDDASRAELIITFLALLEMTRLRMTYLFQDGPLEPIYVELRVSEEEPEAGESEAGASEAAQADAAEADTAETASVEAEAADAEPMESEPMESEPEVTQAEAEPWESETKHE